MKDVKKALGEERADLLALAIKQAESAAEAVRSLTASLRAHGDHGVSCVDAIEHLARCQRLLGALGQNAKIAALIP